MGLPTKPSVDHGFTPDTGPFGTGEHCRVMLARYACPYGKGQHPSDLPPEDVDCFGYRRKGERVEP